MREECLTFDLVQREGHSEVVPVASEGDAGRRRLEILQERDKYIHRICTHEEQMMCTNQHARDDIIHTVHLAILVILVVDHTLPRRAKAIGEGGFPQTQPRLVHRPPHSVNIRERERERDDKDKVR